jgi:hypothetical protein
MPVDLPPPATPLEADWGAVDRLKQSIAEAARTEAELVDAVKNAQKENGPLRAFAVGAAWAAGAFVAGWLLNEVATFVADRLRPPAPTLRRVDSPADSSTPEAT